jgi:hypothetical protein
MPQTKKTVKKYVPTAKEKKNLKDATEQKNMRDPFTPAERKKMPRVGSTGTAKNGKSFKKAQGGNNVVPRNLNKRQLERVQRINETNPERSRKVANRISDRRNARGAENLRMNGDAQFNMKSGGKMKKCKYGCK